MDWSLPYPSSRSPVLADNVVASSQPLASQAGLSMLTQGGTAVDAAIAAAAVLTVTEPTSNGLGSDAFAIVWDGGAIHGLNASGRAPRSQTIDSFGGAAKVPAEGWLPVTVPGAISAWMGALGPLREAAVRTPAPAGHPHCEGGLVRGAADGGGVAEVPRPLREVPGVRGVATRLRPRRDHARAG